MFVTGPLPDSYRVDTVSGLTRGSDELAGASRNWYCRRFITSDRKLTMTTASSTVDPIDSSKAFREAGTKCFVRTCKARTMYVVVSDDYIFGACGDHLSLAIRECAFQYTPPIESVAVFWRPLLCIPRLTLING